MDQERVSERVEKCQEERDTFGNVVWREVIRNNVEGHESIDKFYDWLREQAWMGAAKYLIRESCAGTDRIVDFDTVRVEVRKDVHEIYDRGRVTRFYGGTKIHFNDQNGPCYLRVWWHPDRPILYYDLFEVLEDGEYHADCRMLYYKEELCIKVV